MATDIIQDYRDSNRPGIEVTLVLPAEVVDRLERLAQDDLSSLEEIAIDYIIDCLPEKEDMP